MYLDWIVAAGTFSAISMSVAKSPKPHAGCCLYECPAMASNRRHSQCSIALPVDAGAGATFPFSGTGPGPVVLVRHVAGGCSTHINALHLVKLPPNSTK
ncbi:hypothetical protein LY78DRAFT_657900 [Colletotrichum sublineola]|nr:hypothetical protein LY78DRAFT_657900 [Colletotrichum sublineola]